MKGKIYLWCVPLGTGSGIVHGSTPGGDVVGFAMSEDGEGLTSHYSSSVEFSKHDMGLVSDWKHDVYKEKYPDGYELEWVDNPDLHEDFKKAIAINHR